MVAVFGTLDAQSGGTVPVVYILATFAITFTAMAYVWMSQWVPHAGSVFAYASAVLVIELVVMVAVLVGLTAVLVTHGSTRPWLSPVIGFDGFSTAGLITATSVAVLPFLGFDAIASFAEDNTGDPKQVGRATVTCLLVCGALLVAMGYLGRWWHR